MLYRAHEVDNGLACSCRCPACRHPLIAANRGTKVIPYFRHAADSDCVEGFLKGVLLKAREIVQEAQRLLVPAFEETVRDYAYSKVYTRQVKLLAVEAARMEVESTIQISRSIRPSSRRSRCKCRRTCSTCHRHAIA